MHSLFTFQLHVGNLLMQMALPRLGDHCALHMHNPPIWKSAIGMQEQQVVSL